MDAALAWGIIGALFGSLITLLLFVLPYTNKLAQVSSKMDGFCAQMDQISPQLSSVSAMKQSIDDLKDRMTRLEGSVFHDKG